MITDLFSSFLLFFLLFLYSLLFGFCSSSTVQAEAGEWSVRPVPVDGSDALSLGNYTLPLEGSCDPLPWMSYSDKPALGALSDELLIISMMFIFRLVIVPPAECVKAWVYRKVCLVFEKLASVSSSLVQLAITMLLAIIRSVKSVAASSLISLDHAWSKERYARQALQEEVLLLKASLARTSQRLLETQVCAGSAAEGYQRQLVMQSAGFGCRIETDGANFKKRLDSLATRFKARRASLKMHHRARLSARTAFYRARLAIKSAEYSERLRVQIADFEARLAVSHQELEESQRLLVSQIALTSKARQDASLALKKAQDMEYQLSQSMDGLSFAWTRIDDLLSQHTGIEEQAAASISRLRQSLEDAEVAKDIASKEASAARFEAETALEMALDESQKAEAAQKATRLAIEREQVVLASKAVYSGLTTDYKRKINDGLVAASKLKTELRDAACVNDRQAEEIRILTVRLKEAEQRAIDAERGRAEDYLVWELRLGGEKLKVVVAEARVQVEQRKASEIQNAYAAALDDASEARLEISRLSATQQRWESKLGIILRSAREAARKGEAEGSSAPCGCSRSPATVPPSDSLEDVSICAVAGDNSDDVEERVCTILANGSIPNGCLSAVLAPVQKEGWAPRVVNVGPKPPDTGQFKKRKPAASRKGSHSRSNSDADLSLIALPPSSPRQDIEDPRVAARARMEADLRLQTSLLIEVSSPDDSVVLPTQFFEDQLLLSDLPSSSSIVSWSRSLSQRDILESLGVLPGSDNDMVGSDPLDKDESSSSICANASLGNSSIDLCTASRDQTPSLDMGRRSLSPTPAPETPGSVLSSILRRSWECGISGDLSGEVSINV